MRRCPRLRSIDVSATQTSIRENGETTVITITANLAEASEKDEAISFTIGNSTSGGTPGYPRCRLHRIAAR